MPHEGTFSLRERTTTHSVDKVQISPSQNVCSRLPTHLQDYVEQLHDKKIGFKWKCPDLVKNSNSIPPLISTGEVDGVGSHAETTTNMSLSKMAPSLTDMAKKYEPGNISLRPSSPDQDSITSLAVPWRGDGSTSFSSSLVGRALPSDCRREAPIDTRFCSTLQSDSEHPEDRASRSTITSLQKLVQEKDVQLATFRVKLHNLMSEAVSSKEKLNQYVVEREATVQELSSQLSMCQREVSELRKVAAQNNATTKRYIAAQRYIVGLEAEVTRLQEVVINEKASCTSDVLQTSPGVSSSAHAMHASEAVALVKEMRNAIELLETRNFELRVALAAARQQKEAGEI